tara:strand:+ start:165 stop:482 length:318 start_codon:yes stop_codon:yes gene_type:complete
MKTLITLFFLSISVVVQAERKDNSITYKGTFIKTYRLKNISVLLMDVKLNSGKIITFSVLNKKHIEEVKKLKKNQQLTLFRRVPDACDCICFDEMKIEKPNKEVD